MERRAIVEGRGAQGKEVFGGPGCGLAEELELDVALGGVQLQDVLVSVCIRKHDDDDAEARCACQTGTSVGALTVTDMVMERREG